VRAIEHTATGRQVRMTVELDGKHGSPAKRLTFTVGADRERGEFDQVRHAYAGTVYKARQVPG